MTAASGAFLYLVEAAGVDLSISAPDLTRTGSLLVGLDRRTL
jgi:hypothetical protein